MKMEINGVQTELSVEEFVKLSELLESKTEEAAKEVSGFDITRGFIDGGHGSSEGKREFSVGDVVLIEGYSEGAGVIVDKNPSDHIPYLVYRFGKDTEWCAAHELQKVSKILESKPDEPKGVSGYEIARSIIDELLVEEEEEEEGADLPERFSVGDVVMVNDCASDVGVIVEDDEEDSFPYKVEYPSGVTEWCDTFELHRLEGEELAEYNRDHIGEGHIVVIIDNTNYSANKVGDIGKVINRDLNDSDSVFVKVPGGLDVSCYTGYADMRLATEDERKQYEEAVAELDEESTEAVSYTHLTLPTTPYV